MVFLMLFAFGCELLGDDPTPGSSDVDGIAYSVNIQAIFNRSCVSCHSGDRPDAGLDLTSWPSLIGGSDHGEALIAFSSEQSLIMNLLTRTDGKSHPSGKNKLSEDEIGLLKRWIEEGARGPLDQVPFDDSTNLIYVASEAEPVVTIIDTDAKLVVRSIDLRDHGFGGRARARHIAVEPDGSFWYASIGSTRKSDPQEVVKFSRQNDVIARARLVAPGQLLIHPDRDILYVSNMPGAGGDSRNLVELRRSDMQAISVDVTFRDAYPIAIRPQGDFVFSSSMDVDLMMILNVDSQDVQFFDIKGVTHTFTYFAMAPSGFTMWGSALSSSTITKFSVSNPETIVQNHSLFEGSDPRQLAYTPDAKRVFAAVRGSNRVAVLNAETEILAGFIEHEAISSPVGIAVSSDGQFVFISSENDLESYESRNRLATRPAPGTIVVADAKTLEIVKVIEMVPGAAALGSRAFTPNTNR